MASAADEDAAVLARMDFGSYMAFVHETDMAVFGGHAMPFRHHEVMIEALESDVGNTVIVAPRGSAKTSLAQGFVEFELGKASLSGEKDWAAKFRCLWLSNAATLAYAVSLAIKNTIEGNERYRIVFPKVLPYKDKWAEPEWRVKGNEQQKDATFKAGGIIEPPLGARASLIIEDDIADEKNMNTLAAQDKVLYTLENTVEPMLVPWGRQIMLATRWAWNDPPAWAMERGWHTVYMKALVEVEDDDTARDEHDMGGVAKASGPSGLRDRTVAEAGFVSYWPERFSTEYLLKLQAEKPRAFARQYQNEVAPDEGLIFQREWFEPRFDWLPNEIMWRLNSWDTAAGQGRNRSWTAGWSAVVTDDFHVYLWKITRGQVPFPMLREGIREVANTDRADYVIIEKKSSGHQVIQEYALENNPWKVIEWQPFGQKGSPTRLEANEIISDFCQQGRVHLPSERFLRRTGGDPSEFVQAEDEIFSYPDAQNDDVVDAMCQMLFWVQLRMNEATGRRLQYAAMRPRRFAPAGSGTQAVRV